jgi:hypothetical protein
MRVRCRLLGCVEAEHYPACHRCGSHIYDPWFVEPDRAWVWPLRRLWWWATRPRVPRCWGCRRRLWPWTPRHQDDFCSRRCFDGWIPF